MNQSNELLFSKFEQEHLNTFLDGIDKDYTFLACEHENENKSTHLKQKSNNLPGGIQVNGLIISDSGKQSRPPSSKKYKKRAHPYSPPPTSSSSSTTSCTMGEDPAPKSNNKKARKLPHQLLSDEQKKANHIASEQKRRANIRIGFEKLIDIVPTLSNGHKSEAVILQNSVDYLRHLIDVKTSLKQTSRELQLMLGDTPDDDSSEDELDYY